MARVFSGIQPTGDLHLGNYLGAVRRWVAEQGTNDEVFCVVDLHALTVQRDPAELRAKTHQLAALLVACGLDPERGHPLRPEPRAPARRAVLGDGVHGLVSASCGA